MSDDTVGIVDQGTGTGTKQVDVVEITRLDSTTVDRQRVVQADATNPSFAASVDSAGRTTVKVDMSGIETQLKRIAFLLQIIANQEVSEADVA